MTIATAPEPKLLKVRLDQLIVDEDKARDIAPAPDLLNDLEQDGAAALIQLPTVVPADDDTYIVYDGNHRVASFRAKGIDTMHVIVRYDLNDRVRHKLAQYRSGTRITPLTTSQRITIMQDLQLEGLSTEDIARHTHLDTGTVKGVLTVAKRSRSRLGDIDRGGLDLMQAAALAEFDDDTDTYNELLAAAEQGPQEFAVELEYARAERLITAAIDARVTELTEQGITVVRDHPTGAATLDALRHGGDVITEATHTACPGHAVYLPPIHHPQETIRQHPVCLQWAKHGHTRPQPASTSSTPAMSADDKAQRQMVIANNKKMAIANDKRRDAVAEFLKTKQVKAAVPRFIADVTVNHADVLHQQHYRTRDVRDALLGSDKSPTISTNTSQAKATMLTLAAIAAAFEARIDKTLWRDPTAEAALWFSFLTDAAGYQPSTLEQSVIDAFHA